ncbi:universal stress protein [Microbacterium sp. A93]|uniref:universal stress protein n=1 Tax=Microbacterium sp. A93 TaxID=3450716 RepID=UPI003F445250
MGTSKVVVVGVDGSDASTEALRQAREMAELLGAPLQPVVAWQWPAMTGPIPEPYEWNPQTDAQQVLDEVIEAVFGDEVPDWVAPTVRQGQPAQLLVELSEGARMLVVGSRGRGGFAGLLLGSVSSTVGAHAHCPVLIVHREGH